MTHYSILTQTLILAVMAVGIFMANGIAISSVSVTNRTEVPVLSLKAVSLINIPQLPEFPKIAPRPGKIAGITPDIQVYSQQQQQKQPPYQHQYQKDTPQSSQDSQQSTTIYPMQNLIPPQGFPLVFPSLPTQQHNYPEHFGYDTDTTKLSFGGEKNVEDDYSLETFQGSPSEEIDTTYVSPLETLSAENEASKIADIQQPETAQEPPVNEFSIPPHVMAILNALGSGGSIAQASKPEKDGVGPGYTTANAIGYASGDNATVTASVSNKMEINTMTVILTESASASASSMSNGSAFSQATLASNGHPGQQGWGGWKGGNMNLPQPLGKGKAS